MKDKKILAAYFSCTGTTARVANEVAKAVGADLFEDDLKLALLLGSLSSASSRAGNRNSGRSSGNAELFFNRLDELGELENCHAFDLFDHFRKISHFNFSLFHFSYHAA